jgi:hypothetical protein
VWLEFPFMSERLAIRDFSRLSCQRVICTRALFVKLREGRTGRNPRTGALVGAHWGLDGSHGIANPAARRQPP